VLRKAIYQLYIAVNRGKSAPKGEDPSVLIENLVNNEDITLNDIKGDIKVKESSQFLDAALPNILSIYQTETKSELSRGLFKAKKLLLAAEILNYSLLKSASTYVAEKAIILAKKYYVLDVVFQANRLIYNNGRFLKNRKKKLAHINKIPSFFFHNELFNLKYLKAAHEGNIAQVYQVARDKTEWFGNLSFKYMPAFYHGYSVQLSYCIQVKNYEKGIKIIEEANAIMPKNTLGHFNFLSVVTLFQIHLGNYNEAISIVFKTLNHKKYELMQPVFKRSWVLYEAYVNLLLETGQATYDGRRRRFSIQRFINDLPDYSKDKKAMNIPILIAQMLFFITRKQYNNAIDRIESLGKYTSRYLRNDETFRSMCFIKMILEIPKWSFNRLRVERATNQLHKRLIASQIDLINQPFEIEVIPYEKLWNIIMNELRPDHNYTPKKARTTSSVSKSQNRRLAQGG